MAAIFPFFARFSNFFLFLFSLKHHTVVIQIAKYRIKYVCLNLLQRNSYALIYLKILSIL